MCFGYLNTVQVDVTVWISKMLYWERMSFFYMQNKTVDLKKIHKIYFFKKNIEKTPHVNVNVKE